MRNSIVIGLAALTVLAVTGGAANAQSADNVQKPITIKLGVFLPSSGEVTNEAGNPFFAAGAEYQFGKTQSSIPTVPLLYVDYDGRTHNGAHDYTTGVGLGLKQYLGNGPGRTITPYVGVGVGAYFDQAHLNSGDENKTNLGYKLDAGVEFGGSYLLEVDYQDAGDDAGTRLNGVNILAGVRF